MLDRYASRLALLCLGVYLALAALYSLATPLFEAPDELYHFAVIEHLARTGALPPRQAVDPATRQPTPWRQMAFHAPGYYLLAAPLAARIDTSDFATAYPANPHARIGLTSAEDNVNVVVHHDLPDLWRGTGLAVRLVRLLSLLLGAVTVGGTYLLARAVIPSEPWAALLAMAVVAFNPQFLFLSGVVSNDSLVVALTAVGLWLTVRLVRRGASWPVVLALAVVLGAASLAKASGILLYPVALAALAWVAWRDRLPLTRLAAYVLVIGAAWLVIAGWWSIDNWRTLGDPLATRLVAQATGKRIWPPADLGAEMRGVYLSFWGVFGWFNILAPAGFYAGTVALVIVSAGGWALRAWRARASQAPPMPGAAGAVGIVARSLAPPQVAPRAVDDAVVVALLLGYTALLAGAWWQFNRLVLAGQGRLLFPALPVVALGLAWGLSAYRPRWLGAFPVALLGVAAALFPLWLIAPAYAPTHAGAATAWQPSPGAVEVRLTEPGAEQACLSLWTSPAAEWDGTRGTPVTVRLAWQVHCPLTRDWSVFAHFIDERREACVPGDTAYILSQVDSMPQGGRLPFTAFVPGTVIEEKLAVTPPDRLGRNRAWHVQLGLYDAVGGTGERVPMIIASPLPADALLGIGKCSPDSLRYTLNQR